MENRKLIEEDKIEAYEGQNHDAHIQAHVTFWFITNRSVNASDRC
jgi:hypothetical protein